MNLRDLGYLVAVDTHRHFGRAAAACGISQPTLSAQIKKLEKHCGITLFERDNRNVFPTPLGTLVLQHARRALEEARAIETIAARYADPLTGDFHLGVIPTLGPYLLPLIYPHIRQHIPQLTLQMSEDLTHRLLAGLKNHDYDAILLAEDPESPDFTCDALFSEPFWLAYPRGDALNKDDEVTVLDLQKANILLLSAGHCLRDQALNLCEIPRDNSATENTKRVDHIRAASLETLVQLVGAGLGATLVPALALRGGWTTDMAIMTRPLSLDGAGRTIYLLTRRLFPRKSAAKAIAATIATNLPNTVEPLYRI